MAFIEKNSLLMVLILVSLSFSLLMFLLAKQFVLSQRSKISYSNFYKKQKYYVLKPSVSLLIIACLVIFYGITLLVLFSLSNITRIYLTAVIPSIVILSFCFIDELTISKKNRDLSYFREKYQVIKNAIKGKEILSRILLSYNKNLELSKADWDRVVESINNLTTDKIPQAYCESINNLEALLIDFKNQLDGFDDECVSKFDSSISSFIKKGKTIEIEVKGLDAPEEASVVKASHKVKEEINELIISQSEKILTKHSLVNDGCLIKLLEMDSSNNISFKIWIDKILNYINTFKEKESEICYLFDSKTIEMADVLGANKAGFYWIFSYDIYPYFSKNDFSEILSQLISLESIESIRELLKHLKSERISYFEDIINHLSVKNKCSDLIQAYIDLFKSKYGFAHEINMYENMAYSLLSFWKIKGGQQLKKIESIVASEKFISNKDYITFEYEKAQEEVAKTRNVFIDTIISFRNSNISNKNLFDGDKCVSLYQEYAASLNVQKIEALILLLNAVILIEEKSKSVVECSIDCLKSLKRTASTYSGKLITKNSEEIGKTILNSLLENNNKELLSIINRIEKERMGYEMLVRLWGTKHERQRSWKNFIYLQGLYWYVLPDERKQWLFWIWPNPSFTKEQ